MFRNINNINLSLNAQQPPSPPLWFFHGWTRDKSCRDRVDRLKLRKVL